MYIIYEFCWKKGSTYISSIEKKATKDSFLSSNTEMVTWGLWIIDAFKIQQLSQTVYRPRLANTNFGFGVCRSKFNRKSVKKPHFQNSSPFKIQLAIIAKILLLFYLLNEIQSYFIEKLKTNLASLTSEATPSATQFFKRSYKISHPPGL